MSSSVSIAKSPASSSDPFGIDNVSGFYGPGAWAAWILTLLTSWIVLLVNSNGHNWYFFTYLLYINWAAIDMLGQMRRFHDAQSPTEQCRMFGPLSASLAVVSWGVLHATLQIAYTVFRPSTAFRIRGRIAAMNHVRTAMLLSMGAILPFFAGYTFFITLHNVNISDIVASTATAKEFPSGEHQIPAFYWHSVSMTAVPGQTIADAVLLTEGFGTSVLIATGLIFSWVGFPTSKSSYFLMRLQTFAAKLYAIAIIAPTTAFSASHVVSFFMPDKRPEDIRSIFMPWSPQPISDLDQAFGLFIGLALAAYELAPFFKKLHQAGYSTVYNVVRVFLGVASYAAYPPTHGRWILQNGTYSLRPDIEAQDDRLAVNRSGLSSDAYDQIAMLRGQVMRPLHDLEQEVFRIDMPDSEHNAE
ncbi:hypothetical protein FB567DRAFT_588242 [Paraphoma chrysanthemicola]|uniref:Uncharacterized protein n=1 Tax=Paraphoma chrysanthemicola TaxID=798071 RepID=A0A8K0W1X9_9PLEO|nr:hypothetical protein FB567DRAFT_588242 [Paraphoma chrysanthemicola]